MLDTTDTLTAHFKLKEVIPQTLYVPSGFSPNNDGINDVFRALHSETISEGAIEIYDRWGELVFKSDSLDFAWDGTRKGIPLLEDVYFYRLTYVLYENFSESVQGTITIYR